MKTKLHDTTAGTKPETTKQEPQKSIVHLTDFVQDMQDCAGLTRVASYSISGSADGMRLPKAGQKWLHARIDAIERELAAISERCTELARTGLREARRMKTA